ncbi:predicted protein [Lichtheimia corymbifera JMRC:FSU:9682]|uniref:Uncharacterized protein n=1 Tax=Lichtheimia corymbifera JMRC:FSU:9682 TaxID=1263082 RepID=A0A068SDI9_9FUNG|nr:predicted protein [Lichtheimia corymbifera JMRC:FSU:9682]
MTAPFTADNNQGSNQSYTATGNSISVTNSSNVTLHATHDDTIAERPSKKQAVEVDQDQNDVDTKLSSITRPIAASPC